MTDQHIGYWDANNIPVANSATDVQVATMVKNLERFIKGSATIHYRGWSTCRICKKSNGSTEHEKNGIGIPEGLMHYIVDHKVLVQSLL